MRTAIVLVLLAANAPAQPAHIAPTGAQSPAEELKSFRLPPGFEVQLVAAEPEIEKPIQCSFDAKGRLWVATSRHYPHPAKGEAHDTIYVLSEIDAKTGKAGKIIKFATDLNIPIGVMPLPDCNSCIASEVGHVVKLTDTDGDGVADKREILLDGFGTQDTHGMTNSFTLMPDGWIYACHGFSNASKIVGKDGHAIKMQSGNTYRFRPDGSRVENYTFGQVNPFGMTCDPWFNLYTADCHSKPITQLIPGAHYDSFGKPHDGLGYAPHAARHDHGSTALCGLAWLSSPQFPADYRGRMVLGNVVTNRVNCDKVEWNGASPVANERPDLLASRDPWFRPADCKLGPDGAVYVTDFYNKIIGHYEVDLNHPGRDKRRGRIWRVIYTGANAKPHTFAGDLTAMPSVELDKLLGHDNIVIRVQATLEMQRRSDIPPLNANGNEFYHAHRVWIGDGVPPSAADTELVRVHRLKRTLGQAQSGHLGAHELRALTDGLAANPEAANVGRLLAELPSPKPGDTHQEYAARIALRNALASPGGFAAAANYPQFAARLEQAALGVPTAASAGYLAHLPAAESPESYRLIGRHGDADAIAAATTKMAQHRHADAIISMEALAQGRQSRGQSLPKASLALAERLCDEGLNAPEPKLAATSAALAGTLRFSALTPRLAALVVTAGKPAPVRAAAARSLAILAPESAAKPLAGLLRDASAEQAVREGAALALGRLDEAAARSELLTALAVAPAKLAAPVAQALAETKSGARALVEAVAAGKASPQLLTVRAVRTRLKALGLEADAARLTKSLPNEDRRLTRVIAERATHYNDVSADSARGRALFVKNCAACHRVGDEGGKVGPQLDGVGNRGLDRLLEDVLMPSRNVDAAFRATTIETLDGRVLNGLMLREEGEVVIIADAAGQEMRIAKRDIDARRVTALSPMPANFDTALSESEFRDLMGFLLEMRQK